MTAFTVRWQHAFVLRPALKHDHTYTHPPQRDIPETHL